MDDSEAYLVIRRRILMLLTLDSRRTLGSIASVVGVPAEVVAQHMRMIRRQYRFTIVPAEHQTLSESIRLVHREGQRPVDPAAAVENHGT